VVCHIAGKKSTGKPILGKGCGGVASFVQTTATEALAGLVERVTFHNPENGFCVLGSRPAANET
jgi:hypothetical protein